VLQQHVEQGYTWAQLSEQRTIDRERADRLAPLSQGAVQYRLSSGRIVEADAQLYPPYEEHR
jgi:hypothetical protein